MVVVAHHRVDISGRIGDEVKVYQESVELHLQPQVLVIVAYEQHLDVHQLELRLQETPHNPSVHAIIKLLILLSDESRKLLHPKQQAGRGA